MSRRGNQQDFGTSRETTRLLTEGMVHARESEEVALATNETMRDQRGALEGVRQDVENMKGISLSAAESIRQIDLRTTRRKMLLWLVIVVLFVANRGLVIAMWKHGGKIFYGREKAQEIVSHKPLPAGTLSASLSSPRPSSSSSFHE